MTEEERKKMYEFVKEFWHYLKEFWVVGNTDEWWDRAITTADRITDKYQSPPNVASMTTNLLVAALKEFDNRNKKARTVKLSQETVQRLEAQHDA